MRIFLKMKSFLTHIFIISSVLILLSCGEDRTWEYEEKTQHNHWALEQMRDKYLWGDSLADFNPTWKNFFSQPSEFMGIMTAKSRHSDSWSYVEIDTISQDKHQRGYFSHVNSYGFDFTMMTDPTGQTTRSVLRVLTVYPGSPADRAGLLRNDYICAYNGYRIASNNLSRLQTGGARQLEVRHISVNEEDGSYVWKDTVEVEIEASEYVEDKAFPVSTIYNVAGSKKVGYLMCNRLLEYPVEKNDRSTSLTVYQDQLEQMMQQMKDAAVDEMVLDLRLCNYGTLNMAQRLASHVVTPAALHSTFAKTYWNERYKGNNLSVPYNLSLPNLGLSRIYILTSPYTQGAAEWLIHSLQCSMGEENVILIGTATKGQNVMTQEIGHQHHVRLFPAVAYVADGEGNYDYNSISPSIEVDEYAYLYLGEYGTNREILLSIAIDNIIGNGQNDTNLGE